MPGESCNKQCQDFVKVILTEIQMLSTMAQCRMQIEKCKIAFCQIGTVARLHDETCLVLSHFDCGITKLQVNTFQLQVYKLQVRKL